MKCKAGGQCAPGPEQIEGNLLVRYCLRCGLQTGWRRKPLPAWCLAALIAAFTVVSILSALAGVLFLAGRAR